MGPRHQVCRALAGTHAIAGDSAGPAQLSLQRCARLPQTRA